MFTTLIAVAKGDSDEYPAGLSACYVRHMGYHSSGMRSLTPLRRLKFQGIRIQWRVCPQLLHEKQWRNKYVESTRVLCLDGGSSPPISTK